MTSVKAAPVSPFRGFLRLARFKFLLYNILLVGLGAAVTVRLGTDLHLGWYLFAQLFAWIAHLMTHYCNEYFDLEADRANVYHTPWTGGSRARVDGLVSPVTSLGAAFVLWTAGLLLIAAMPTEASRLIAAASLALAWFYTAPPVQTNYRELTVAIVLNGLWPALAAVLQRGDVPPMLLAILVPTAVLQTVRMMVMNLGDRRSDALVGKRTIPVLIGHERAVAVITIGQVVAYALLTIFAWTGSVPRTVWLAMMTTLPLSASLVRVGERLPWRGGRCQCDAGGSVTPAQAAPRYVVARQRHRIVGRDTWRLISRSLLRQRFMCRVRSSRCPRVRRASATIVITVGQIVAMRA